MSDQKIFGNNKFLCHGKFIAGPDYKSCIASFLMIVVPGLLWQIFVGDFFADRYSIAIPVVVGLLTVASIALLLRTAFSDPGIMPRQKDHQEYFDSRTESYRKKQPPRYHDIVLRGHPFKLKYCITCNIYRPPRCTHCSVCENCIERFDHHCPWIGNCIGKRNYWLFYSFVTITATLNVLVLATSLALLGIVTHEVEERDKEGVGSALVEALKEEPLSFALIIYNTAVVWFTVGLCSYHTYLVCTNQTTYEQIKGVYGSGEINPFHRGVRGNCYDFLCAPVRPRFFEASGTDNGHIIWPKRVAIAHDTSDIKLAAPLGRTYGDSVKNSIQSPMNIVGKATHGTVIANDPYLTGGRGTPDDEEQGLNEENAYAEQQVLQDPPEAKVRV